jgi:hypothetical protein
VPEREAWLWENKFALAMVQRGVTQAAGRSLHDGPDLAQARQKVRTRASFCSETCTWRPANSAPSVKRPLLSTVFTALMASRKVGKWVPAKSLLSGDPSTLVTSGRRGALAEPAAHKGRRSANRSWRSHAPGRTSLQPQLSQAAVRSALLVVVNDTFPTEHRRTRLPAMILALLFVCTSSFGAISTFAWGSHYPTDCVAHGFVHGDHTTDGLFLRARLRWLRGTTKRCNLFTYGSFIGGYTVGGTPGARRSATTRRARRPLTPTTTASSPTTPTSPTTGADDGLDRRALVAACTLACAPLALTLELLREAKPLPTREFALEA